MAERSAVSDGHVVHAVVFDYGHTLIDFSPAGHRLAEAYESVREMLTMYVEYEVPEAHALAEALSRTVQRQVSESFERGDLDELDVVRLFADALAGIDIRLPDDMVREIAVIEHRALTSHMTISLQNLDVLRTLRSNEYKLGIVSNAHFLPEMMWEDIQRLGIATVVHASVFSSEVGVRKPHPAIFRKVLDEIGVSPE